MLLGQELKFKNKLCNLKLGTFFSALPGLGASALSGRAAQSLLLLEFINSFPNSFTSSHACDPISDRFRQEWCRKCCARRS